MLNSNKTRFYFYALLFVSFVLLGADARAQDKEKEKYKNKNYGFCSNNWSNGDKVGGSELREVTVPGGSLTVDGKRNGGIRVKGENRSDVLVRAFIQTWGITEAEAQSLAKSIRIETGGTIRAEGASDEKGWSVSSELLVPRNTNLKLTTMNGGISISDVEGTMEFDAQNGGIHLNNLAGSVKGRTTNGGLHIELAGNTWKGDGIDVETTNGGVHLTMAENYAARFETRTVNGGFKSDIAALQVEKDPNEPGYRRQGVNISRDLNGGGALVRIVTTNGGVKIGTN